MVLVEKLCLSASFGVKLYEGRQRICSLKNVKYCSLDDLLLARKLWDTHRD